ncbi:Gag-Pro-Pol polyprotein [Dictyocoela muelleri]|nr:Gag-Pro-Pol polyprotein [Dictyocoela muelleri]
MQKTVFYISRNVIRIIVSECNVCKKARPFKENDIACHIISNFPNERFQIYLIDLSCYSAGNNGLKWVLSIIDIYSRFGFVKALENKTRSLVAASLKDIFMEHGPCKHLQSDNRLEFKNKYIKKLCDEFNIEQIHGQPNNSQSQGIVERFNQTLTRFISKNISNNSEKKMDRASQNSCLAL